MIGNLKTFGLVLVAVLALGALWVSMAQAAKMTAGTNTKAENTAFYLETKIEPAKAQAFGVETKCESVEFTGEQVLPSETETMEATIEGCTTAGFPSTVTTNGCVFVMNIEESIGEEEFSATTDLECPGGQFLEIETWFSASAHSEGKTPVCIVKASSQTGIQDLDLKVDKGVGGGKDDLTSSVKKAKGITVSQVRNSFLCPSGTESSEATFEMLNPVTHQATEDTPARPLVDLWVD